MRRIKYALAVIAALLMLTGSALTQSSGECGGIAVMAEPEYRESLVPGGMAFGVKYFTKGALVIGITDIEVPEGLASPARDAGIEVKDIVVSVNGNEIKSAEEFIKFVNTLGGETATLVVNRGGEEITINVKPVYNGESYKLGIWVRDSTAGIGTVTCINAQTGEFAGLGHGICDSETGILMPLEKGVIVEVDITGVVKGQKNAPGELKGKFDSTKIGELYENTDVGVFGKYDSFPFEIGESLEVGFINELQTGEAYIYTTLDETGAQMYSIDIEKIYDLSGSTKNFLVHVTDETLIEKTGGIVQGMSGSPIIQNGRLVGAVTHVLVNDPTRGYGIHIENMLSH